MSKPEPMSIAEGAEMQFSMTSIESIDQVKAQVGQLLESLALARARSHGRAVVTPLDVRMSVGRALRLVAPTAPRPRVSPAGKIGTHPGSATRRRRVRP